jgi:lipoprotein-anchoring transpeptidase ErfK/SrfK
MFGIRNQGKDSEKKRVENAEKKDFTKDLDDDILEDLENLNEEEQDYSNVPGRGVLESRKKKKTFLILGSIAGVVLIIYVGFSIFFESHFYFRSVLNGVPSSGATAATVMNRISKKADDYSLTIKSENVSDDKIVPADIDMKIANSEASFQKILDDQNGFKWVGALFKPVKYQSNIVVKYNKDKLKTKMSTLSSVANPNVTKSANAYVKFSDGKYDVIDEVYGNEVDQDKMTKALDNAIMTMKKKINLKKEKCYIMPELIADSDVMKNDVKELNEKIGIKFEYNVGGTVEKVDKATLASFMSIDPSGKITYNEDNIAAFVKEMADKYNTAGKPKTLATSYGSTVTVAAGSYGWKINRAKEAEKIKSDLNAKKDVSRDFEYSQTANSRGANDYGNSYVEVNRTAQHVYVYKNGAQIISSDVVTGNVTKGRETHVGAYFIAYKEKDATLRGEDYESKVSYWMPFHNGEGLHDATWQPSFGGTYYKVRGSHGCVNLPLGVAKSIFENVTSGYPVLIYDLPGTENNAPNTKDAENFVNSLNGLGAITDLSQEATVANLRKAYNKLTPEAQAMVTNYNILTQAEASIAAMKAAAGIA